LFSSVNTIITSPRKEFIPSDAESSTIGDLWVRYLMEETDEPKPEGPFGDGRNFRSPSYERSGSFSSVS